MFERVSLAMKAVGKAAMEIAGRIAWPSDSDLATGNICNLMQRRYCKRVAMRKLGIEIPRTEMTEAALSRHLLWNHAEMVPKVIPPAIERINASDPKQNETGKPLAMIWLTVLPSNLNEG